ncbi:hypothetical protein [Streptomyces sp. NPDC048641]|uniref:hypothetical protein n=1 Tax=Streptomyces sp. NPDC048641 TaxID=3154825 RepID=UPI003413F3D6
MRDHLVRVLLRVEPPPGADELAPHVEGRVGAEALQDRQGALVAQAGGRGYDRVGLLVRQVLWSGEEFEDERARLRELRGLLRGPGRDQGGGPFPYLFEDLLFDRRGVLKARQREQGQARAVHGEQAPQERRPLPGAGVGHGHPHDVLPLRVAGVAEQDVEVALLDRVARTEVVEERPVREVDHLWGGAAQDTAAQQEVAQDRGGVALAGGVGDGGQGAFQECERGGLVHLGAAREHQGVGETLEEFGLVLGVEFDAVEAAHAALPVAVGEDHLERGVVQGLAAWRQIAAARGGGRRSCRT